MLSLAAQLLSLLVTMVLARLLTPEDFGLIAAANIIVGATVLLTQFGLNTVLVQRVTVDSTVSSTLFWASGLLGLMACGLAAFFAHPLAGLVGVDAAGPIILALTPVVFLRLLAGTPQALLQRRLHFTREYAVEGLSLLVAGAVQLALAITGFGAWSIVGGQAAGAVVLLPALMIAAGWLPRLTFSTGVLIADARFSAGMLTTTLFGYLGKNVDYWFVAHALGARALGVYYMAYVLPTVLRQRVTWVLKDVLVPVFAQVRDDAVRTRRAYLETLRIHALIGMPVMIGLALLADDVIELVFGNQWSAAAAPIAILALAAMLEFVKQPATTIFLAHGVPGVIAMTEAVRLSVMTVGLVAAAASGGTLTSFSLAVLAGSAAAAVVAQALVGARLRLPIADVMRILLPVMIPSGIMATVVLLARELMRSLEDAATLAVLIPLGASAFLASALVLFPASTAESAREAASALGLRRSTRL